MKILSTMSLFALLILCTSCKKSCKKSTCDNHKKEEIVTTLPELVVEQNILAENNINHESNLDDLEEETELDIVIEESIK